MENIKETIVFSNKNKQEIIITITKDGRIGSIVNESNLRFPYSLNQPYNRNLETWACNNGFKMNGKSTCPEKKIFGIKISQIPKNHEWRRIYPNKFRED